MKDVVEKQYDSAAAYYDRRWARYVRSTLSRLVRSLALRGTERILDVACGTGELESLLLSLHPAVSIVGVDLSEGMLAVARSKDYECHVEYRKGAAGALPVERGAFDLVVCASAFHYFPDPSAALRDMERALAPGGRIVILDWCRDYPVCALYDFVLKLVDEGHVRCLKIAEMLQFAAAAGLSVVEVERFRIVGLWGMMQLEMVPLQPWTVTLAPTAT